MSDAYENLERLCDALRSGHERAQRPTAILAGHFVLVYCPSVGKLLPGIAQELHDEEALEVVWSVAAQFPLRSFNLGADLIAGIYGPAGRLVILVNDHGFTSFQAHMGLGKIAGRLRRSFFQEQLELPSSYLDVLTARRLSQTDCILRNDDSRRPRSSVLPRSTPFFSETVLRNHYENRVRLHYDHAMVQQEPHRGPTTGGATGEPCHEGCVGEMLDLYLRLQGMGYERLVMLSPEECATPMAVAADIAVRLLGHPLEVAIVRGLGGADEAVAVDWKVRPLLAVFASNAWGAR